MVRRRGGLVDPQRDLERVAIEWVIRQLEEEGHDVQGLWYPDYQPADPRVAGRASRPDGALLIDGREAAIDVTGFWSVVRGQAGGRARRIRELAEAAIDGAGLDTAVLGFVHYDPPQLAHLAPNARGTEERVAADAALLAAAAVDVARQGPGQRVQVDRARVPRWVERMTVTVTTAEWGGKRHKADLTLWPGGDVATEVSTRLAEIAESKGRQLAEWGLGIIAIAPRGLSETAEAIAAGLAARDDWPFWRVYWQDARRAYLVWSRPDRGATTPRPRR